MASLTWPDRIPPFALRNSVWPRQTKIWLQIISTSIRVKMPGRIVIILSVLLVVAAQVQLQPKPLTGIRGQNLTVTCSFPQSTTDIQLSVRGISILLIGSKFLGFSVRGNTAAEFRYGPLEASDDGAVFECDNTAGSADSASLDLLGEEVWL